MPYFNWEYRPAPKAKTGSYRRQYGSSWWGKEFLNALQRADNSGRLGRGKTYANKGLVLNLDVEGAGKIKAKVQGSRSRPYSISMNWEPWPKKKHQAVLAQIQNNPAIMSRLLAGKLPPSMLDVLREQGLSIFPERFSELQIECGCPDWATPCKHQAAVLYILASEIDSDPFRLFALKGLDLRQLVGSSSDEEMPQTIPALAGQLQEIQDVSGFSWNEETFRSLDFGQLSDTGWAAVQKLPEPTFDTGRLQDFFKKVYTQSSRFAKKCWANKPEKETADILPLDATFELHLDEHLHLQGLYGFDDEDNILISRQTTQSFIEWLMQIEQLERHVLDAEARSLLLFFQLARKIIEQRAYVPQLLDAAENEYVIRYLPSVVNEPVRELLEKCYSLISPKLLYYAPEKESIREFTDDNEGEQLLSAMLGCFIRLATENLPADNPLRKLLLLRGKQAFELIGTEKYPQAINRWLRQLHLSKQAHQPVFQVQEVDDGLEVELLIQEHDTMKTPVPLEKWLQKAPQQLKFSVIELLGILADHYEDLDDYLAKSGKEPLKYAVAAFTDVLMKILPTLQLLGLQVVLPATLKKLLRPQLGLSIEATTKQLFELSGIISLDDMLKFRWQSAIGDYMIKEAEFRKLLTESEGLVKFKEGYAYLNSNEVAKLLNKLDAGPPVLKPHERLQALFSEEYDDAPVRISPQLRKLIDKWRNSPPAEVPNELTATLRPYQLRGYQWMYANSRFGFGSIIADDMGLGKTVQVIALTEKLREENALIAEKALVVVPTSLMANWKREIERFAPKLRPFIYHGSQRQLPEKEDYDVLLTTYGTARSDAKLLAKEAWRIMVIDEAQAIKNPAAKQSKAIKSIKAPIRIAMSGTPVENRLLDYWSVMDYTLPKYLGSQKYFSDNYGRPIQGEHDQRVANKFRKITAPFVMRRLKTDKRIISDLPDKIVQTEYCSLTAQQTALYQSIIDENMRMVEQEEGINRQGLILKLITALKQCCNHPVQFLKKGVPAFEDSGKALMLRDLLGQILENGDKTLIFTQYREMGDILTKLIEQTYSLKVPFLHGGTTTKQREQMVQQFQQNVACPIFLLSIKAGGTGLNLTAANHVIHYDLWWNPAVEAQATDRAYRIGQEKNVFVHRLVTDNTFENKIDKLIESKRNLADLSVGTGESWVGKMSNQELAKLVRLP